MYKDLISVIIPVYNCEEYLDNCISSVVNQIYENLEIILINDGSTDNSIEICKKWKLKDERIMVIDQTNKGPSETRNVGLREASGEYIGFVDSDDNIDKNMYSVMIHDIKEQNADIVMCNNNRIFLDGKIEQNYTEYEPFSIDSKELVQRMLQSEKIFCSSVWSKLYKKKCIDDVRFDEEIKMGEDYLFNGIIYSKINKLYYNNRLLYNYHIREESLCTSKKIDKHFFDKYNVAIKLEQYYENLGINIQRKYFDKFKFSALHEIVYGLYSNHANKKIKKEWKKKYHKQRVVCIKDGWFKLKKSKIKVFLLDYFPNIYVLATDRSKR